MRRLYGYVLLAAIIACSLGVVSTSPVLGFGGTSTFSVGPTPINRHQPITININVTGDLVPPNTYSYNVTITLPNLSKFSRIFSLQTTTGGIGSTSIVFPRDFLGSDTILDGQYQVHVAQTVPTAADLMSKPFSVSNFINLTVLSPASTANFTRGDSLTIVAQAKDIQGRPFTGLNVSLNTPTNNSLSLADPFLTGVYSQQYTIKYSDPYNWRIVVNASDRWGNFGSRSVNILVQAARLQVDTIQFTDSSGRNLGTANVNQTIYVFFNARYPDGSLVTSGSASVSIIAPNGQPMRILNATYTPALNGFFTQTGYFIPTNLPFQPSGKWSAKIYSGQLNDGAGNTGPITSAFSFLDVGSPPFNFSISFFAPFLLLGLGATGSVLILTRKGRTGFEYFDKITGGGIPDGSLVMLYGESKSGKSILLGEMLYKRLREGKPCIYITYELTTEEILKNAKDFKWELEPYVESGLLTLIDNSDLMSSLDLSKTRMKLSSALTLKENKGLQLFIDSMDLLFEDLDYREVKLFLSKLTEEVRKLQGSVYFSLTTSQIIQQTIPEIQDIIDWSIELQTKKKGNKIERTMCIKRIKEASFKGTNSRFKLVKKKGMVFDVPLIRRLGRS